MNKPKPPAGAEKLVDLNAYQPAERDRPKPAFKMVAFSAIKIDPTRRPYLVKGLLPNTGISVIWGPPKCGKSFWALDVALHVALGWEYRGRRVRKGTVVYLALEGAEGFKARITAFRERHNVPDADFHLITAPLDMVTQRGALIADIRAQLGDIRPAAVFIDTLNRSLKGSESKDEDMAKYISAAEEIASGLTCCVPIIHHCGIDASRPRGHTSLTGAVEAQIAVKREGPTSADGFSVTLEYMKDGPEGETMMLRLEQVTVGRDPDGDDITTCLVVDSAAVRASAKAKVKGANAVALRILREALEAEGAIPAASNHIPPNTRTISVETWRRYAYAGTISESDKPGARQKAFVRACNKLQEANLIGIWAEHAWIT